MTAEYTPKEGDKVRLTYEGEVIGVDSRLVHLSVHGWVRHDTASVEWVEAARVPFEVGKPLAPEMGEPPAGTLLHWNVVPDNGEYWLMGHYHTLHSVDGDQVDWWDFVERDNYTVEHLPPVQK